MGSRSNMSLSTFTQRRRGTNCLISLLFLTMFILLSSSLSLTASSQEIYTEQVSGIRSLDVTDEAVTLLWTPAVPPPTGYKVFVDESPVDSIADLEPIRVTPNYQIRIRGLEGGKTYHFAVVGYNDIEEDPYFSPGEGNTVSVTLDDPPAQPVEDDNSELMGIMLAFVVLGFALMLVAASWVNTNKQRKKLKELVKGKKDLNFECPQCNVPVSEKDSECPNCGATFDAEQTRCSVCRAPMKKDQTVCKNCGTDFSKGAIEKYFENEAVAKRYANALSLVKKGKLRKALSIIDDLLKGSPSNAVLWNDKGYILMKMGRENAARDAFERALDHDPDYQIAQRNLLRIK